MIQKIILWIIAIIFIGILGIFFWYATQGELDINKVKADITNKADKLLVKPEKVEIVIPTLDILEFQSKLKEEQYVVGELEEIAGNTLGADKYFKFTVDGYDISFLIFDLDKISEEEKNNIDGIEENGYVHWDLKDVPAVRSGNCVITGFEEIEYKEYFIQIFKGVN